MKFSSRQFLSGCLAAAVCALCGLLAAYSAYENILIFPAPAYIASTIFLFMISGIKLNGTRLVAYCFAMMAAYVLIFVLTAVIANDAIVLSVITAGFGAVLSFKLVHFFIKKIRYSSWLVFFAGSLSMAASMLVYPFVDISRSTPRFFDDISLAFIPAFFLWNVFVGLFLFFTLNKPGTETESKLSSDYWFKSYI